MAYFAPYIDSTGIHIPSYEEILQHMIDRFKEIYGNDCYLEEDSQDYQFLSSFSLLMYDSFNTIMLAYNNMSPTTAIGSSLDRLCAINGVVRKDATYSSAEVVLTGAPNTRLNYGQIRDLNGYVWQLSNNLFFDRLGNLTTTAYCTTIGQIEAAPNTIKEIVTPAQNWYTATNPSAAFVGQPVEHDSNLRERRFKSVSVSSTTQFESMISYLRSMPEVKRIVGYENDTSSAVNNIPAHSVAIVAECDNSVESIQKIGEAIYLKKTPGTGTYGNTTVEVEGSFGIKNTVKFTRPEDVQANVTINLVELAGYSTEHEQMIKKAVVDFINSYSIGESLYVSSLYLPILSVNQDQSTPYFYVSSIEVNGSSDFVSMGLFQDLVCTADDITINVS